jgi:hypothetical protein
MTYKHEVTHKQILESYHAYLDDDSGHQEIEEVYAKAKALDKVVKIVEDKEEFYRNEFIEAVESAVDEYIENVEDK